MTTVGLARMAPHYQGLNAPFDPGCRYPEFAAWPAASGDSPNHVYQGVRSALAASGLDASNFGSARWNPLGALVPAGGRIVLKPNFIRHWNPAEGGSLQSLVTHGAVLRAMADYAWLAAGPDGSVVIAEAPQHDCEWDVVAGFAGVNLLVQFYREALGRELEVIDLRREAVRYADGVVVERRELPGDPAGYRLVDLGQHSAFEDSGLDPRRFRGADYDSTPTTEHHAGGKHEYLLSETVLSSDLVVNLPKLKTHKKTGITLALKNLVGINGDKNLLPHHCVGSVASGGDEFPGRGGVDRLRSRATEVARRLLRRGFGSGLVRLVRRAENAARGTDFIRSGNWHGNQTTWRMCLDLNRILYYSDKDGSHFGAAAPVHPVLTVLDGVIAGEGEGPLAPTDRGLGVVLVSSDPVALDLAAVRLMGFDPERLPKILEAMQATRLRLGPTNCEGDVEVQQIPDGAREAERVTLSDLAPDKPFVAHPGWQGHVERSAGEATRCAG